MGNLGKVALVVLLCCFLQTSQAQGFQFGVVGNVLPTQVDGDGLRGFSKMGFEFGVVGGYTANHKNYLVFEGTYKRFGSRANGKSLDQGMNQSKDTQYEWDFKTISLLLGYAGSLAPDWDGNSKFRYKVGVNAISVLNYEVDPIVLTRAILPIREDNELKKIGVGVEFGVGLRVGRSVFLDIKYNHLLTNLLKTSDVGLTRISPYHLGLGVTYYISGARS